MQAEYARRHTDDLSPLEVCGRMDKRYPVSNGRKPHEAEKTRCAFVVASCGAGRSGRRVVSAFIATAFAHDNAANATRQWRSVADQLRPKLPKLATVMDDAKPDVLAYMDFPARHRTTLHSTNPLERLNGGIKRRTEVVGAILLEQNDEWAVRHARYMTLETIAPISDTPTISLSAVAA